MSAIAVEEFLAHYGVKGMRWGSRKSNSRKPNKKKKGFGKKLVIGVGSAAAVGVGALFVSNRIKSKKVPVRDIKKWAYVEGPNWKVQGEQEAVAAFVKSKMEMHYRNGEIM